jgi:predicted LPLAT superfamily acyltransferase
MTAVRQRWHQVPEAGTAMGIRAGMLFMRMFGRRTMRRILRVVAFYNVLLRPTTRRASRDYLRRVGQPHAFGDIVRHLWCFAVTVMDRLYFVQDRFDEFEIHRHGHEHLLGLVESGRGGILLGAHIGSFEVMRTQSHAFHIPLNIVGDFTNADRINGVLRRINPNLDAKMIPARPGGIELALTLREAIGRGELVGILGDRTHDDTQSAVVDFLGDEASLPVGPYVLASVLDCPIYLVVAVHRPPNRYDLYCEPFAESIQLPRGRRDAAMRAYAQRYAERLEHYCKLAPHNWFNFFDFWKPAAAGEHRPTPEPAPR